MRFISLLIAAALCCSCSSDKKESKPALPEDAPATQDKVVFDMMPEPAVNPTNVVVSVDGSILRAQELDMETRIRLSSIRGASMNPEAMAQMKNIVVDQFITRTLLLNKAKALEIKCTEEDLQAELNKIEEMIPEDMTMEEMLDNSPLGREAMLEHIKNKIVIDKLSEITLKASSELTEEEVNAFIEKHQEELKVPESVEARHILIQFGPDDDDTAKAEKKNQLEAIRKELLDGADFAEVAKAKSSCPSGQNGGHLGRFGKFDMVPEFSEAAFSQEPGEIGEVVTTPFGHHLIKVDNYTAAAPPPRDEVKERLSQQKMQSAFMEYISKLREKADIQVFTE